MLKYILAAVIFATPAAAATPICTAQESYARFIMTERQKGTALIDIVDSLTRAVIESSASGTVVSNMLVIITAAYRRPIVAEKQQAINDFSKAVYNICESSHT